jgi:hypothetical protein
MLEGRAIEAVERVDLRRGGALAAIDLAGGLAGAAGGAALLLGPMGPFAPIALCAGALALYLAAVVLAERRFSTALAGRVATVVLLGPLGALGLGVAAALDRRRRPAAAFAAPEAPPRGRPEAICADILQNRRPRPRRPAPFDASLAGGGLEAQQAVVAAISRRYGPDMRPALMRALASRVPAVRVQAAAVYARLRERFQAEARALMDAPLDGDSPAEAARRCRVAAASGFLDDHAAAALLARAVLFDARAAGCARAAARRRARDAMAPRGAETPAPRLKRYSCGGLR